jgi:hypothetical protein|tara:strand:- start:18 stop:482 length:465 start_codon:yes stop_codon:yes gene_type:complete
MAGVNQMSRQMGISKGKASSLMKKAKKMNGYEGGGSFKISREQLAGKTPTSVRKPTTYRRKRLLRNAWRDAMHQAGGGKPYKDLTEEEKVKLGKTFSKNVGDVPTQAIRANWGADDYSRKSKGFASGGMARVKGTPPAQVKGFTYNDNGGEGTF